MRPRPSASMLLTLSIVGLACDPKPATTPPLRVAAASDLQEALPILIARFRADTGIAVEPTFGASGQLAQQIRGGAPFDLFLAANRGFVDDLARDGVVKADSVRPYARGALVLVVNDVVDPGVKGLVDLASDGVKTIALANPDLAPYGAAGKQALERAGLWEKVRPKLVIAGTVRQAMEYVRSGNAEVGLVGRSVAAAKGVRVVPLAPDGYDPIIQGMGIIADSKQAERAVRFATFLTGEIGQGMLREFGFLSVPTGP